MVSYFLLMEPYMDTNKKIQIAEADSKRRDPPGAKYLLRPLVASLRSSGNWKQFYRLKELGMRKNWATPLLRKSRRSKEKPSRLESTKRKAVD